MTMTHAATIHSPVAGAPARGGLGAGLRLRLDRYRRYQATRRDLSRLTDRELADIGISRAEIDALARRAARTAFPG